MTTIQQLREISNGDVLVIRNGSLYKVKQGELLGDLPFVYLTKYTFDQMLEVIDTVKTFRHLLKHCYLHEIVNALSELEKGKIEVEKERDLVGLDLYLKPACEHCGKVSEHSMSCYAWNYTYNVSPMWYKACPEDERMIQIDGMTGGEALVKIRKAREKMEANPGEYLPLNPPNGWGSYPTFIAALKRLEKACEENPAGIWCSSR